MKTTKKLATLFIAFVMLISSITVYEPQTVQATTITVSSIYNTKVKGTVEVTVTTKAKALKAAKAESKRGKFVLEASHQKK